MDKFGIFNILNSLLNNKTNTSTQNSSGLTDANNFISSLLNTKKQPPEQEKSKAAPPLPLQTSMLSTMNSHDQFVKRVMEKNKKKH